MDGSRIGIVEKSVEFKNKNRLMESELTNLRH